MGSSRTFWGTFIIILGILFLLQQWGAPINFESLWPVVLLIPGIYFWWQFYTHRDKPGFVIPGTILVLYSLYFFFNQLTDYRYAGQTSFIFVLAVACGLFAMYYFQKERKNGLLVAGWIITGVALINLVSTIDQGNWWPLILIIVGLFLLYKKKPKTSGKANSDSNKINNS